MARVTVKVHPRARRTRLTGRIGDAWKLDLAARAADGYAIWICYKSADNFFGLDDGQTLAHGEAFETLRDSDFYFFFGELNVFGGWLTVHSQALQIASDGVLHHLPRFLQSFAFGHQARQGRQVATKPPSSAGSKSTV